MSGSSAHTATQSVDAVLSIDVGSPVPRHRQVYDGLRAAILSGRLRPGERLPATRSLSQQLDVSRATVEDAYDQLRTEGYVVGRQGSGTYVASPLPIDVSIAGTEESRPGLQMSLRGRRLSAGAVAPSPSEVTLDLRPHRAAPDVFPWEDWRAAVGRALTDHRAAVLETPPPGGYGPLRQAIADHVHRYRAVRCAPDDVLVVNGSQQGLNLVAHTLLDEGDRAAVEDPGYPAARLALEAQGLRVARV